MSGRIELWLFVAQRASAAVLAPLVLVHLASIIGASRGGLTPAALAVRAGPRRSRSGIRSAAMHRGSG